MELSFGVGGRCEEQRGREESSWEEGGPQRTGEVVWDEQGYSWVTGGSEEGCLRVKTGMLL